MADERIFLDETFPIVKYNNSAPVMGLHLLKRRENAQVGNVRVIVTDKRIVVDEKMVVLANIAAVSVGDDANEVAEQNKNLLLFFSHKARQDRFFAWLATASACFFGIGGMGNYGFLFVAMFFVWVAYVHFKRINSNNYSPTLLTPDYAVVIESAGTRDNALVSKDRMVVQKIVRAISDALLSR